jgi:hypothetical protein
VEKNSSEFFQVEKVEVPAALLQVGVLRNPSGSSEPGGREELFRVLRTPPLHKFIYPAQVHFTVRRECMHKDELINLHQMLSDVKDYFEEINPELKFSQYTALKITPSQQHKSKMEHKYAIFVLGTEIANAMKEVDYSSSSRISARMKELADKTLKEMEYP